MRRNGKTDDRCVQCGSVSLFTRHNRPVQSNFVLKKTYSGEFIGSARFVSYFILFQK